jgi:hypothetical protein
VTRHLLPSLQAMNFVLDEVLDGGVNDALNLDSHGKALAFLLLDLGSRSRRSRPSRRQRRRLITFPTPDRQRRPDMTRILRADRRCPSRRDAARALAAAPAWAQGKYPERADHLHRAVRRRQRHRPAGAGARRSITADTKQAVIVDNKAGASGMMAAQARRARRPTATRC